MFLSILSTSATGDAGQVCCFRLKQLRVPAWKLAVHYCRWLQSLRTTLWGKKKNRQIAWFQLPEKYLTYAHLKNTTRPLRVSAHIEMTASFKLLFYIYYYTFKIQKSQNVSGLLRRGGCQGQFSGPVWSIAWLQSSVNDFVMSRNEAGVHAKCAFIVKN